jgi:hypothetical protein
LKELTQQTWDAGILISTAVAAAVDCANLVSATADEIFCWLHRIVCQQGGFRCYEYPFQTFDVLNEILEQRVCFAPERTLR